MRLTRYRQKRIVHSQMALTPLQLRRLRATTHHGNRVRAARQALGLTQVQLAALLGLRQSTLSDIERQRYSDITIGTARKFADFFGCAIEDLFPARQAVAS